jgi:hypothetical protein
MSPVESTGSGRRDPASLHQRGERELPIKKEQGMSDKKKQPNQTTMKPDDDAITPRELTPEEAERTRGGINQGGMSQVVNAGMDGGGGMDD